MCSDCRQMGDKSISVRRLKMSARYRSGKSDGELLIAVGAGDCRALEELYLGYQRRLARFLSRFTRRGVIVEEIINDTFMVVCHIGHSLVEIAEITGAPVGTVKARMFHAREKLRRHLPSLGGIVESPASVD